MGRSPCCHESGVKKGPWTPEEDEKLIDYINKHGHGNWGTLSKRAGLNRCGKSCRLRWTNYLRPDIKRGKFTDEEETLIINLHSVLGNKWSKIATHLPGRTDNEIKNFWNTHIRKKLLKMGLDPETHKPRTDFNHLMSLSQLLGMSNMGNAMSTYNWGNNNPIGLQVDITQLAKMQLLQNLLQIMNTNSSLINNMGNNPYSNLLGNPSFQPFLNGITTNTLQSKEPVVLSGAEEYAIPGLYSDHHGQSGESSKQDVSKSWAELEGGSNSNPQQDLEYYSKISSTTSGENNQEENPALPALVNASSPRTGTFNQMDNGCNNTTQMSTQSIFDDWDKFLEDETSGSYWKELLDLTSTSASPISW